MTQHAYPKRRDLTALAALLIPWNAGIQRARVEYADHPTAACIEPGCEELALIDAGFCRDHAHDYGFCVVCQSRQHEPHRDTCRRCRGYDPKAAAARMRRRRAHLRSVQ